MAEKLLNDIKNPSFVEVYTKMDALNEEIRKLEKQYNQPQKYEI
ncbi:MAG: hypothetical protein KatS3mg101_1013 [Patescibacteria group bacterium]|nr:MAG: hypothetical protein KatS3mg101_1013 [Patescibacteria group bacterium]